MRNRFGWLGRGTTPWGFLNQLISHLRFNTILIGYRYSTFCHWESTLSPYATYCHCNIHLTFLNTTLYSNTNKLQLSIQTITITGTHPYTSTHITYKLQIYIHITQKQHQQVMLKVAELDLCFWYCIFCIFYYCIINHFN